MSFTRPSGIIDRVCLPRSSIVSAGIVSSCPSVFRMTTLSGGLLRRRTLSCSVAVVKKKDLCGESLPRRWSCARHENGLGQFPAFVGVGNVPEERAARRLILPDRVALRAIEPRVQLFAKQPGSPLRPRTTSRTSPTGIFSRVGPAGFTEYSTTNFSSLATRAAAAATDLSGSCFAAQNKGGARDGAGPRARLQ